MARVTTLFDTERIAKRVDELAEAIAKALPRELLLVVVLKGGFVFAADLMRALDRFGAILRVDFLRLSSYGTARESSGNVRTIGALPDVAGCDVLLVDDIVDTGRSLVAARQLMLERGAASVATCVLLDKRCRREIEVEPDFVGFPIEDVFVVGYGIDFAEQHRQLPYIGTVD